MLEIERRLTNAERQQETLHSLNTVAKRLGGVSIWTVRRWCQLGKIESVRLGARRLVRDSELQRVMAEGLR